VTRSLQITYVKSGLHADLLAGTVKGHIGTLEIRLGHASLSNNAFGKVLGSVEAVGNIELIRRAIVFCHNITMSCKAVLDGIIYSAMVKIGNEDSRGTTTARHSRNKQANGASTEYNDSVAQFDVSSPGGMNSYRKRLKESRSC
jgi:hypothetical protein